MKKLTVIFFSLLVFISCKMENEIQLGQKYEVNPYLGNAPEGVHEIDTFFVLLYQGEKLIVCKVRNGKRNENFYYEFKVDNFKRLKPKLID